MSFNSLSSSAPVTQGYQAGRKRKRALERPPMAEPPVRVPGACRRGNFAKQEIPN
jgi:hypothetical protein